MTDKEINEYLAENLFGLVRQKDFGEWNEHDWEREDDGSIDNWASSYEFCNGPRCSRCWYSFCEHCVKDYQEALKKDLPCIKEAPNYIKNYQDVLYKAEAFVLKKQSNSNNFEAYFNGYKATDFDLGRAVCLAAINCIKAKKGDEKWVKN